MVDEVQLSVECTRVIFFSLNETIFRENSIGREPQL